MKTFRFLIALACALFAVPALAADGDWVSSADAGNVRIDTYKLCNTNIAAAAYTCASFDLAQKRAGPISAPPTQRPAMPNAISIEFHSVGSCSAAATFMPAWAWTPVTANGDPRSNMTTTALALPTGSPLQTTAFAPPVVAARYITGTFGGTLTSCATPDIYISLIYYR